MKPRSCSPPGYVANVSTIAGLLRRQDYAVLDKDAHNSLVTGAQLSGATLKRFSHNDVERLGRVLRDLPDDPGKAVIVDGVYSMGGETAPLDTMLEICREHPNTFLLDDEAHGLGVLGERGRGAAEHYGVLDSVDLITLTFSKTLGSCGGALIGSKEAIELLTLEADTFIFTASNTPGSIAAALQGLRILRDAPEMAANLRANVDLFVGLLADRGVPVNRAESAIITIPLRKDDEVSAVVLARELLDAGVFVNPVVSPAVQKGLGLLRLSLMLDHTPAILEEAAQAMLKVLSDNDQLPRVNCGAAAASGFARRRSERPGGVELGVPPRIRSKRRSQSSCRLRASWMNGEYPIALIMKSLNDFTG